METYIPPIAPPERAPDSDPSQPKPRWNVFEIFKKQAEGTPVAPEVKTSKLTERAVEHPALRPERRKFAATVIALLPGESAQPVAPAYEVPAAPEAEAVIAIDRVTAPSRTEIAVPEAAPEVPQFVERAKEVGKGVLRLIGRVRQEVDVADRAERLIAPTDLEPLVIADTDVRAAMEELVAPIEALAPPITSPEQDTPAIDNALQTSVGGEREVAFLAEAKSPFARTLEVAASVATITAREALGIKERAFKKTSSLRKVGLFALGATTAGGFIYTWKRVREIKKEQLALRREHKRFEAEVRAAQAGEERRLHELEESNIQGMTRPERQQYVQEVSEFAHAQATEIRTTARMREVVQQSSASDAVGADTLLPYGHDHQTAMQPQQQVPKPSAQQPARTSSQAWLWGMVLITVVGIFIVLGSLHIL